MSKGRDRRAGCGISRQAHQRPQDRTVRYSGCLCASAAIQPAQTIPASLCSCFVAVAVNTLATGLD